MKLRNVLAAGVALSAISAPTFAQEGAPAADGDPVLGDNVIIVTAVAQGQNRLESSVSVSALDAESIADLNPSSSADLIRQIPGIRSEASGGEGNANIAVRGIPVSTGGARYIQLQEDGLPVLEFGDIVFGNADNFVRADRNVGRVEAVRGGSASTFASNSPGGVINFISKTGLEQPAISMSAVSTAPAKAFATPVSTARKAARSRPTSPPNSTAATSAYTASISTTARRRSCRHI